ncbi:MAG: hypothetical protein P4L81_03410 [Candidatus Pacebacteria bacterium]|nr:hypothetical protein [Candidatus Paceibacterota bacterium]
MQRPLAFLLLAALAAVVMCGARPALAFSAQVFEDSDCNPATVLVYSTKLKSGSCVKIDRSSAKTTCNDDGTASAALYIGNDCQVLAATGAGKADGQTCVRLPFRDGSGVWGAYIDCSAAGPDPALSPGAVAGIAVGASLVGLVLLGSIVWWAYRRYKAQSALQLQDSIHMKEAAGPSTVYASSSAGMGGAHPAGTLNVALLACVCAAAFLPCGVKADTLGNGADTGLMFEFLGQWTFLLAGLTLMVAICCPGAFRAPPRGLFC